MRLHSAFIGETTDPHAGDRRRVEEPRHPAGPGRRLPGRDRAAAASRTRRRWVAPCGPPRPSRAGPGATFTPVSPPPTSARRVAPDSGIKSDLRGPHQRSFTTDIKELLAETRRLTGDKETSMSKPAFPGIEPIRYQPDARPNALAFRYYDKDKKVRGKRMEDHLRMAVCYWHTFVWNGFDVFGAGTFGRAVAPRGRRRGAGAGEGRRRVRDVRASWASPFFCFHDRDVAPEGETLAETQRQPRPDRRRPRGGACRRPGVKLLWGTANLFSHPRYMARRGHQPGPGRVRLRRGAGEEGAGGRPSELGGANYVLWGGREGYETLLNTDMKRELDQLGRFLHLVVDYKQKIGFKGTFLIEPKPQEPTKHQYDFDVGDGATRFLQRYGLEPRTSSSTSRRTTPRWPATASSTRSPTRCAHGIFGSIDMNRGDPQLGWDTDQFPQRHRRAVAGRRAHPRGGRLHDRRLQLRRQGPPPEHRAGRPVPRPHRRHGQPGARAADRRQDADRRQAAGVRRRALRRLEREARQGHPRRQAVAGRLSERALADKLDPKPRSGRQEMLENLVNRYL